MSSFVKSTALTLQMIKWEHSVFALPFALTGAVLAADGIPTVKTLFWIVVCMVAARTAAMAFNRLADAEIDRVNPRTSMRALPAGDLSRHYVAWFVAGSAALFLAAAAMLNRLTLELAPVVLVVVLGYSYTKRFTRWSHLVLGLALGIAPSAAWIAVRGTLDLRIVALTVAVLFWVAGFDILYACQDFEHDRRANLNSVPQAFGLKAAFWIVRAMHLCMVATLVWTVRLFHLGNIALAGIAAVVSLLLYEHAIVSPRDLRRMNAAFFLLNGFISIVFFGFVAADVLIRR